MDDVIKYLVWLGVFLAVIGPVSGQWVATIALAEFVIGIIIGILLWSHEKDMFHRAMTYAVLAVFLSQFTIQGMGAVLAYVAGYVQLMAWMYLPAAVLQYLWKAVKEGY